jgi:hypothetical protein
LPPSSVSLLRKCWYLLAKVYRVTSQKTAVFIVTASRTSSLKEVSALLPEIVHSSPLRNEVIQATVLTVMGCIFLLSSGNYILRTKSAEVETLLICVRGMPGSNFTRNTGYPESYFVDFFGPTRKVPGQYLKLGHCDFILHPSPIPSFTIYCHV